MKDIIYLIGLIIITAILYAIPIITACSFFYAWNGSLKILLILTCIIEFGGLYYLIDDKIYREDL